MTTIERARVALDPKKLKLPARPPIEAIEVEEFVGWEGEEGLRVQVILGEDTTDDDLTGESGIEIDSSIRDALLAQGIEDFPYVFVAKRSELESLDQAE